MSEHGSKTGGCLCGAVRFELHEAPTEFGACHCSMCRKIGGGVEMGMMIPPEGITWTADADLKTYQSSEWAERGFCGTCGSSLFWRLTAPGPQHGLLSLSAGSLDSMEGMKFTSEVYIDHKPTAYAFAGSDRNQMTEADVLAMVNGGGEDG